MNTVTCGAVCVCAAASHKPRRVGVYWILMGCLGKTLSPLSFLYHICSQMCGPLSCEHAAGIKALFIFSLLHPDVKRVHSLSPAVQLPLILIYQLARIGPNWELVGIQVLIINAASLWFVTIRRRNYVSCSGMSARDSPNHDVALCTASRHTRPHTHSHI